MARAKVSVEKRAIHYACDHYRSNGYDVKVVSGKQGHGYDLVARKGRKRLRVEVKGCTRLWGIADPYSTEFDAEKRLVADILCVVYFLSRKRPFLCLIPRHAIPADMLVPKAGYRIRSQFKKESMLGQSLLSG